MSGQITRRALVALAAALRSIAQTPAAQPLAASAPLPSTPEEELNAAKAQNRGYAEQLAKVPLPAGTEPATHFKA